jgi:hypothetical protein
MFTTLLLALSAGVSTGSAKPVAVPAAYSTSRAAHDVAQCLSDSYGPVSVLKRGERLSITSKDGLDVQVEAGQAKVKRVPPLDGAGTTKVRACLD